MIWEKQMNRGLLSLASVAALFCMTSRPIAAELLAGFTDRVETPGVNSGSPEARQQQSGTTSYYVDCATTETNGDGRSPAKPWSTLDEVNGHSFSPGDAIYLKRGTQ